MRREYSGTISGVFRENAPVAKWLFALENVSVWEHWEHFPSRAYVRGCFA
jgi:hypothetical protein